MTRRTKLIVYMPLLVGYGIYTLVVAVVNSLKLALFCKEKRVLLDTLLLDNGAITVPLYKHNAFLNAAQLGMRDLPMIAIQPFEKAIYINDAMLELPKDLVWYMIHHELGHLVMEIRHMGFWKKLFLGIFRNTRSEVVADGYATGALVLHPLDAIQHLFALFHLIDTGALPEEHRTVEEMLQFADERRWQKEWKLRLLAQLELLNNEEHMQRVYANWRTPETAQSLY